MTDILDLVNLTSHDIVVRRPDGTEVTLPPSGQVARVDAVYQPAGMLDGVPVVRRTLGAVEGLPAEGTPCVVSSRVASAVPRRRGVYAPDTGDTAIRDDDKRIIAVIRLVAA